MTKKAFNKILLETVDDALGSLGDSAKQSIYFHLESKFKVARDDIPDHIEGFEEGLEKIFGVGAKFIEIMIMKKLHQKIGKPLEWDENRDLVFTEYVGAARQTFLRNEED